MAVRRSSPSPTHRWGRRLRYLGSGRNPCAARDLRKSACRGLTVHHSLTAPVRRSTSGRLRTNRLDRWLGELLQRSIEAASVRVVLWDGHSAYERPEFIGDLVVRDRRTLLGLILNPNLYFGEAYMSGRLVVRGPLEPVVESLSRLHTEDRLWVDRVLSRLSMPTSLSSARRNVHAHYDLGNDFYKLWLDSEMLY